MSKAAPNILFLFPDQHRGDFMPYDAPELEKLGYHTPFIHMKNIRRLMDRGMTFTNTVSASPLCAPARACLAQGERYYHCHVPNNDVDCPTNCRTFYQILRENGYQVGGVGKFDLHKADKWWGLEGKLHKHELWGFTHAVDNAGKIDAAQSFFYNGCPTDPYMKFLNDHGWAAYHAKNLLERKNSPAPTELPDELYCDNWITDNAISMIRSFDGAAPWFLQVNFAGPHDPWDITQKMKQRALTRTVPPAQGYTGDENIQEIRQNYCEMIENIDWNIGRIEEALKEAGMYDDTVIVYCSDHGEMLGDCSQFGKNRPHRSSAHIPLVIGGGPVTASGVSDAPVELQDLAKTFTDLAGCHTEGVLNNSHSLYHLLLEEPFVPRERAYSSLIDANRVGNGTRVPGYEMIEDHHYKYIEFEDGTCALYDRQADVWETKNLAKQKSDIVSAYQTLLAQERKS